jgi:FtsH-binding integral membrane protein
MSATTPALLAAAAGVGFGHAILPDHWVPLAVIGRTRRYPLRRVARLSLLAGIAHVLVSIAIGGVIIIVGLQLRSTVQSAQDTIIGCLLIATGVGFALLELLGLGHRHDGHEHHEGQQHDHEDPRDAARGRAHGGRRNERSVAAIMVPFGAAASPDLTILPVFLAATTAGVATAIGSIVGLTLVAAGGGYRIQDQWLDRWGNAFTAAILVVIGTLVLSGVL